MRAPVLVTTASPDSSLTTTPAPTVPATTRKPTSTVAQGSGGNGVFITTLILMAVGLVLRFRYRKWKHDSKSVSTREQQIFPYIESVIDKLTRTTNQSEAAPVSENTKYTAPRKYSMSEVPVETRITSQLGLVEQKVGSVELGDIELSLPSRPVVRKEGVKSDEVIREIDWKEFAEEAASGVLGKSR